MKILLSNDDGITSNGLIELAKRLSKNNEVMVVAPDHNYSAVSHTISLNTNISYNEIIGYDFKCYSLTGTPADCVKFALLHFKDFKPDIVVGGINKAHNIGSDILYSGTVAIALEGTFFGHVGFAFSAFNHGESDFKLYSNYAEKIINQLLPISDTSTCWNINFPDTCFDIKGIKIVKTGVHPYSDHYELQSDNTYRLVGTPLDCTDKDKNTDVEWIQKGYITVTPISLNRTNLTKLKEIESLCIKL